ncbi:hypothetical protein KFL_007040040 [Klebsormidium nitens]|uniref:Pre-rRNA-processing protein RIX1 N-terminal domain-containing protein n=1 Tax=Klebsormidium nitens TaxID=105231 RepID=A0A1Y1IQB4_KLENI|nr:hypothetical protein KFL_007040040 [Klebsormidium nitens]|eukprot:GAQ90936.1 hypothetical protein KFL_007040040 [Klebsormidium nitens]
MSSAALFLNGAGQGGPAQGGTDLKALLLRGILATLFPPHQVGAAPVDAASPQIVLQAASTIEAHQLLRETDNGTTETAQKQHQRAVDQWVDRLSVNLGAPGGARWAAACLAGLTCKEIGAERFLALYQGLAGKLVAMWKEAEGAEVVGAVQAALSDLVGRLGQLADMPGVRREGAGVVAKIVQPLIGALGSSPSQDAAAESLDLLIVSLQSFPSPFRHHSEAVETAVINLLLRGPSDITLPNAPPQVTRAATALALLPVAAGDAATWSALIHRLLIALNTLLVPTLSGLESPASFETAASLLLPQGSPPPPPLGRFDWSLSNMPTSHLWPPTVPVITSILTATRAMLTSAYPVSVPIPVAPILALVARLLNVVGTLFGAGAYDALSGDRQAALLAELPNLQKLALDLAVALLAGAGTHLLPHGEQLAGFVGDVLRRTSGEVAGMSVLRVQAYRAAEETLACLGAGVSLVLAPTLVPHALSDLRHAHRFLTQPRTPDAGALHLSDILQPQGGGSTGGRKGGKRRKGGRDGSTGGPVSAEVGAEEAFEVAGGSLRAIEKLLAVGGPLIPEKWRTELDAAIFHVAHLAAGGIPRAGSGALRLAACRALLASVTSPGSHRPPYLPQALAIFRRCRSEIGTPVGAFSTHALLVLEPFLHPRSLPVLKLPGGSRSGGVLPAADAAPRNAFSNDPWQEAEAWLGYGAGFRHGLEQCESAPEEQETAPEECEKAPEGREPSVPQREGDLETGAVSHHKRSRLESDGATRDTGAAALENRGRGEAAIAEQTGRSADVTMSEAREHADVSTPVAGKGSGSKGLDNGGAEAGTTSVDGMKHVAPNEGGGKYLEKGGNDAGIGASGTKRLREEEAVEKEVRMGGDAEPRVEPGAKEAPNYLRPGDLAVLAAKEKGKLEDEPDSKSNAERESAAEAARNVFGLMPRKGGDADSDSEGPLPSIVDGDPDDDDFM